MQPPPIGPPLDSISRLLNYNVNAGLSPGSSPPESEDPSSSGSEYEPDAAPQMQNSPGSDDPSSSGSEHEPNVPNAASQIHTPCVGSTTATAATRKKRKKWSKTRSQVQQQIRKIARRDGTSKNQTWQSRGGVDVVGGVCKHCTDKMQKVVDACKPALRTAREIRAYKGTFTSAYNSTRLKACLLSVAFNVAGEYVVHRDCLIQPFSIGTNFLANLHRTAVTLSGRRWTKVTKAYVLQHHLQDQIIVPDDELSKTTYQYLASLGDKDRVDVAFTLKPSVHGLSGEHSNNRRSKLRQLFVDFVKLNRSPTGRTRDDKGRAHGSLFYLDSKFQAIKLQTGQGAKNPPEDEILSQVFLKHATQEPHSEQPVHPSTIGLYFTEMFGINSEHGHTTQHPHKSDACPTCEMNHIDHESLKMSLKRHESQPDVTDARKIAIAAIKQDIKDGEADRSAHVQEAALAQRVYKSTIHGAHEEYSALVAAFGSLIQAISNSTDHANETILIGNFAGAAASFKGKFSSDYQMDKPMPAWHGKMAQPGPTYFLSKLTHYVHGICAESLGEATGATRHGRNIVYTRPEPIGGAKDANDTISTMFDLLLAPTEPTCPQPKLFRTGYDKDGAIPGAKLAPSGGVPAESSAAGSNADDMWAPIVPDGFVAVPGFPFDVDVLVQSSGTASQLEDSRILYNWGEDGGWLMGVVERANKNRRYKDQGTPANFVVGYAGDGTETYHNLQLCNYTTDPASTKGSWLLITPKSQTAVPGAVAFTHMEAVDHLGPPGYTVQQQPPIADDLAFKSARGKHLIKRKFIQKWPNHGWCVGTITRQNTCGKRKEAGRATNFFASYDDQPEIGEASQALYLSEYGNAVDAEDFTWALLEPTAVDPQPPNGSSGPNLFDGEALKLRRELKQMVEGVEFDRQKPHPLMRSIIWYMDNCTGTNKNQFVMACLAILCAVGVLDAALPRFMLPYHGKFGPDLLFQKSAGSYNSGETFNHAMLLQHFERYATAQGYDGNHLLRTWKEASASLFRAVEHISSYRQFLILADDGSLDLEPTEPPAGAVGGFPDVGDFYEDGHLMDALSKLQQRSIPKVVGSIIRGDYCGIGAGVGGEAGRVYNRTGDAPRLLPTQISKVRKVRMFKKLGEDGCYWVEQESYQKTLDPTAFCIGVSKAVPYATSNISGQCASPYWGARAQQILDQMSKFTPPQYVPDHMPINNNGLSRSFSSTVASLLCGPPAGGCTDGCAGGCTDGCAGGCTGGCAGGCTGGCAGGCAWPWWWPY